MSPSSFPWIPVDVAMRGAAVPNAGWRGMLGQAGGAPPPEPLALVVQYLPLLAIVFLAWMLLYRPERQRQLAQQQLRDNLKRNDHVVTAGGIYGTVSAVDRDADRVTLKVDESNNVKIDVTLGSVLRVVSDAKQGAAQGTEGAG